MCMKTTKNNNKKSDSVYNGEGTTMQIENGTSVLY